MRITWKALPTTLLLAGVFHLSLKLVEDAVISWINGQIADQLGLTAPTVAVVVETASYAVPIIAAAAILAAYHYWISRSQVALSASAYTDTERAGGNKSRLMTIVELRNEAKSAGWNFIDPSIQILDLADALREAGSLGDLVIFGRKDQMFGDLQRRQPLVEIPATHWSENWINAVFLTDESGRDDNYDVRSYSVDTKGFCDLHVERQQALKWLRLEASLHIGRNRPRGKLA